jgi:hypothetical protein
MKQLVIFVSLAAVVLVVFACSSSSSNGGGSSGGSGGYSLTNCPNEQLTLGTSAECLDCVQSKCGSEVTAVNSACASLFACGCPTGADAAACPSGSLPDGGVTPCGAAIGTVTTAGGTGFFGCALTNCLAQCTPDGG